MPYFADLKNVLESYLEPKQVADAERAYQVAECAHDGQMRSSGDPYITHPVAAANILAELKLDHQTIMAALMHDVIEDCDVTKQDLTEQFGDTVADLVEGVSKLTQIDFQSKEEAQAENFRKMMMAMTQDIRVILIKLADRLHNMQTLGALRPDKRRRIARETLEIYAPIANRLGIHRIKEQLELLGFANLYPLRYKILKNSVKKVRGHRKEVVERITKQLRERLNESGLKCQVIGREKSLYSIYKKMRDKVGNFHEVMDIYAFRVITDTEDSCYRVLGQIHNLFKPIPGRFKDYIAIPKANGYQSLHTVLRSKSGMHIEVQIRTELMDQMAEHGVAAHWLYKTGTSHHPAETKAREWLQSLVELQQNVGDSIEFIENVKIDLYPDEVYVFTPKGKIIELPKGATPVDFAYAIHTDIGNTCIACKIDKQFSPLSTPLVNGRTVEIITAPGSRPNPAWLSYAVTGKARTNIRNFVKNMRHDEAVHLGRRLLEQSLKKSLDEFREDQLEQITEVTRYSSLDDLLAGIGLGKIASALVAHRLTSDEAEIKEVKDKSQPSEERSPLAIKGTEGLVIKYAKCCRPIPGDPIMAYVSPGRGFNVHRENCPNIQRAHKQNDHYVPVQWADELESEFATELRLHVFNQRGVLAQVTNIIANQDGNIVNVDINELDGDVNIITFLMGVKNRVHLANIIKKLRVIPFVNKVYRYPDIQPKGHKRDEESH
ncbi:bifunctional GTP diphosphokinase/guanosine-3',5'-bis pyrophosphate 3'-pyrophosphohydrolase [Kangiella sediminilitoris]|uniref:guanosine-3',5'-bis(diphosphate) 3'-diphosphatase n=1 Tax=Kangiella sediminilitoris TaxID=1144748 RepID=A0A1B3B812_9GAMM|nr:bifunctional GTP diphosphokinase/guanosine-3',5'-bis pyrophosphate 3'-pyrophosphohydrolase [Kangiella sediminilitoris]AOE48917.1 (p)ppGpp synthetase [Kangiella sediminilitoris]